MTDAEGAVPRPHGAHAPERTPRGRLGRSEGVDVALSSPCSELRLPLPFRDHRAPVDGFQQAERRLSPHRRGYSKAAGRFALNLHRDAWPQAVQRAFRCSATPRWFGRQNVRTFGTTKAPPHRTTGTGDARAAL